MARAAARAAIRPKSDIPDGGWALCLGLTYIKYGDHSESIVYPDKRGRKVQVTPPTHARLKRTPVFKRRTPKQVFKVV